MKVEKFIPIKGYEDYYEVCNIGGKVKSLAKTWSVGRKGETILKFGKRKTKGRIYYFVVLCVDKVKKYAAVHRLVAEHFCENPNGYDVVNHLDSDTLNNDADNLEWTTTLGNVKHSWEFGNQKPQQGEKHGNAKLTEIQVKEIRELYKTGKYYHSELAALYSVSRTQITRIINGTKWQHIL